MKKIEIEYPMISQKICRGKKTRKRVGELVAFKKDDKIHLGVSLCCHYDTYDKEREKTIAINRALKCYERDLKIPQSVEKEFKMFIDRCIRYFKTYEFPHIKLYNPYSETYERGAIEIL